LCVFEVKNKKQTPENDAQKRTDITQCVRYCDRDNPERRFFPAALELLLTKQDRQLF